MARITRAAWFDKYILPKFENRNPEIHINYAIYGNKSRVTGGFDHRTKSEDLRQLAEEIHNAEVKALNAFDAGRMAVFYEMNEDVHKRFLAFIAAEDAVMPHKSVRRRESVAS